MKELFKSTDYCAEQILKARERWGNRNIKRKEFDAIGRVLAFMYLYCPEEIKDRVLATLNEHSRREVLMMQAGMLKD